jgi:WD40 repeat protein
VVLDCSWSPDSSTIVSASADKTIRLWCPQSQAQVGIMYGHREAVNCCAISPDGRRIATGSDDRTLKLWNTARRSKVATLTGHQKGVLAVAFSPDSKKVVSGGNDKMLIEWSAVNAKKYARHRTRTQTTPTHAHTCAVDTYRVLWWCEGWRCGQSTRRR